MISVYNILVVHFCSVDHHVFNSTPTEVNWEMVYVLSKTIEVKANVDHSLIGVTFEQTEDDTIADIANVIEFFSPALAHLISVAILN